METLKENKILFHATISMLVLSFLFLIGIAIDERIIIGLNPWIKPLKFSISILSFILTMALVLRHFDQKEQKHYSSKFVISMWIEIILITIQSARGVRSHFNEEGPFDIAVYAIMGLAILYNTFYVAKLTLSFFRKPLPHYSNNELHAIRIGLVILLFACLQGMYMSPQKGHTVGAIDGGPGLFFFNWSTIAGDLRVSHFIGLHAIQILLIQFFMTKSLFKENDIDKSFYFKSFLTLSGFSIFALMVLTFIQALMGKSLITFLSLFAS